MDEADVILKEIRLVADEVHDLAGRIGRLEAELDTGKQLLAGYAKKAKMAGQLLKRVL